MVAAEILALACYTPPKRIQLLGLEALHHPVLEVKKASFMVDGDLIPALWVKTTSKSKRRGIIYVQHPHSGLWDLGKNAVLSKTGQIGPTIDAFLANGFDIFAIDAICFGERKHFADGIQGAHQELGSRIASGSTLLAKVLSDTFAGLSIAKEIAEQEKIPLAGFWGFSYGAKLALWIPLIFPDLPKIISTLGCITYRASIEEKIPIQMEFLIPNSFPTFDIDKLFCFFKNQRLLIQAGNRDKWSTGFVDVEQAVKENPSISFELYECEHQIQPGMIESCLRHFEP